MSRSGANMRATLRAVAREVEARHQAEDELDASFLE